MKNNNKTILDKISQIVFGTETFADVKDTEGNILRTANEELAVGDAVTVILEDGTEETAKEGSYVLEDGRTIVVDAEGNIAEIVEPATEEDPEEEAMAVELVPPGTYTLEDGTVINIDELGVATYEVPEAPAEPATETEMSAEKARKEEFDALNEKYTVLAEKFAKIQEKLAEVSGEPAEKEIKVEKVGLSTKQNKMSIVAELAKYRKND